MKIHKQNLKLEVQRGLVASLPSGRPFTSVATVEGIMSRDSGFSRQFDAGAIRPDQIPFPLLYGHDADQVMGRVDAFYTLDQADLDTKLRAYQESPDIAGTPESQVWVAEGYLATNELARDKAPMIEGRFLRGVSVGGGQVHGRIDMEDFDEIDFSEIGPEAELYFDDFQVIELSVVSQQAIGPSVIWFSDTEFSERPEVVDQQTEAALVASGQLKRENDFLLHPPESWFTLEGIEDISPGLTITNDGRIYGYLALFNEPHTGFDNRDIYVPIEDGHKAFRIKSVLTAENKIVQTGVITMCTNHAPNQADANQTQQHYDHTGYAVADVTVLNDGRGYVLAGSVRTTVSPEDVRALRGANVSGDWRSDRRVRSLRLRAVLAVNVPGYIPAASFSLNEGATAFSAVDARSLVASFTADEHNLDEMVESITADLLVDEVNRNL